MRIDNPCGLSESQIADVAPETTRLSTTGQLLALGRQKPSLFASPDILTNVVVQDEFTHDVVVALASGVVLVYDST